jgi:hypothetical protein
VVNYVTVWLTIISCSYIFFRVEPMINSVSWRETKKLIFIPYSVSVVSILAGSMGTVLFCMAGYVPQWHEVFFTGGVALALLFDRRGIVMRNDFKAV